jgi:hypothetical protein
MNHAMNHATSRKPGRDASQECRACRHFRNDAAFLEAAFPGLTVMSSGYGSVRSDDGICLRHDRYLGARSSCADFSASSSAPPECASA